ncbi:hypothetical protein [Priestia aryabhattai]
MEYVRIQDKIIDKLEKEVSEINFRNLKSLPIFNFNYFQDKTKREFVNWYMEKSSNICLNVNLSTISNEELLLFQKVCESLGYWFILQYTVSTGFAISTFEKVQEPSVLVLERAVEALRYFDSNISSSQRLRWYFDSQRERTQSLFLIQRLVYGDIEKEKVRIVKNLNDAKQTVDAKVCNAFEKVLGVIYKEEIRKNICAE